MKKVGSVGLIPRIRSTCRSTWALPFGALCWLWLGWTGTTRQPEWWWSYSGWTVEGRLTSSCQLAEGHGCQIGVRRDAKNVLDLVSGTHGYQVDG